MSTRNQLTTDSRMVVPFSQTGLSRRRVPVGHWLTIVALVIIPIIMVMPFVWLVSSSLKSQMQIFQYPPQWIPNPFHWDNFSRALTAKPFGLYLKNTLTICVLNVIAVVFSSSLCAYGF